MGVPLLHLAFAIFLDFIEGRKERVLVIRPGRQELSPTCGQGWPISHPSELVHLSFHPPGGHKPCSR